MPTSISVSPRPLTPCSSGEEGSTIQKARTPSKSTSITSVETLNTNVIDKIDTIKNRNARPDTGSNTNTNTNNKNTLKNKLDNMPTELPPCTTVGADEWIIKGKVYKFDSEWIRKHPGGSTILNLNRGRDCSELFETYHFLSTKSDFIDKKLKTYYVRDATSDEIISPFDWQNGEFLKMRAALKNRLFKFIESKGIKNGKLKASPKYLSLYSIMFVIMSFCFYYTYTAEFNITKSLLACFLMGFCGYALCLDVCHSGTHYSLFESSILNEIASYIIGSYHCVSWTWFHQHVINHHSYTNIEYLDTDLYWFHDLFFANDDQLNLIKRDKLYKEHPYNENLSYEKPDSQKNIVLGLKLFLSAILSNLSPNVTALPAQPYPQWLKKLLRLDFWSNNGNDTSYILKIRLVTFTQFIVLFIIIPGLFIMKHGFMIGFLLWVVPRLVAGAFFSFFSQVTHINELECFDGDADTFSPNFIVHQVTNAVDYACEDTITSFFAVNLNNQGFHHLLPGIHPCWYVELAPLFSKFCKDFGIKQNVENTLFEAQYKRWLHLKNINCIGAPSTHSKEL